MIQVEPLTGAGALGSGENGGEAGRVVLLGLSDMGIARDEEERWERWDAGHLGAEMEVWIGIEWIDGVDDGGRGDEEGDGVVLVGLMAAGDEIWL